MKADKTGLLPECWVWDRTGKERKQSPDQVRKWEEIKGEFQAWYINFHRQSIGTEPDLTGQCNFLLSLIWSWTMDSFYFGARLKKARKLGELIHRKNWKVFGWVFFDDGDGQESSSSGVNLSCSWPSEPINRSPCTLLQSGKAEARNGQPLKNSEQEKKSEAGLIRIFILGTSFHRLPCLLSICCIFDFPIIPLLGQGSEERKTTRVRESGPLVTPSNYGSEEGKEATTLTKRRATERTNHGFGIPMQAERVSPPDWICI